MPKTFFGRLAIVRPSSTPPATPAAAPSVPVATGTPIARPAPTAVSRTPLAAEEMVSPARSRALASDPFPRELPLDRGRELPALPRVRLAAVLLAAVAPLPLEELRLEELDEPPRDCADRARLAAAEDCGLLPSPPLFRARDAACVELESDPPPLELRAGPRDLVVRRCVAVAIF